jgi:hypothetical protein
MGDLLRMGEWLMTDDAEDESISMGEIWREGKLKTRFVIIGDDGTRAQTAAEYPTEQNVANSIKKQEATFAGYGLVRAPGSVLEPGLVSRCRRPE